MDESLFHEFPEVSPKQWKLKIQYDLKGAEYTTLLHKTPEGIDIKPFYTKEDYPENTPLMPSRWHITQPVYVAKKSAASKKITDSLQRGAESILVTIPSESILLDEFEASLSEANAPIIVNPQFLSLDYLQKLDQFASRHSASVIVLNDPISKLARSGNWYQNKNSDLEIVRDILSKQLHLNSGISIDASLYHNAGATAVQEIAYAIAHAHEYLALSSGKHTFTFQVAIGPNYFMEIAKLRALRIVWQALANEYTNSRECIILAQPGIRNKTLYDYNVNLLRSTTECMSAILGGANYVSNLPYDSIYHKYNEFSDRIARNQLLILKHESYFDKVENPADGAYYIESLTDQLASKALELFKSIENGGGFLTQLKEHTIQRKIKESARASQEDFNTGRQILIGTNQYPNPQDRMKDSLELYPFVKTDKRKTLIEPIIERRLSEIMEQERLATE